MSSANRESPKKLIRNSSSFNSSITLIFNLHKCLEMVIVFNQMKKDVNSLFDINP